MNCFKKVILAFLAVNVLVVPALAGLLEEVDNLTPEEALEFEKKLQQKKFEALPDHSGFSGFVQFIEPTGFNNAFAGVSPMTNLYGVSFDLRHPVSERFLIGGNFSGAGNYILSESSSNIYEDLFLIYGNAQFVLDFRLVKTENFMLGTTAGVGIILGGYNYTRTDDNAQTYYATNRWGSGFNTSLALEACWSLWNGWGLGCGLTSFSGKLGGMRKVLSNVDNAAPDIDLSGTTFKIFGRKDF